MACKNNSSLVFTMILIFSDCVFTYSWIDNAGLEIDGLIPGTDIRLSEQDKNIQAQQDAKGRLMKRNHMRDPRYLWHDKVIPYEIHSSLKAITSTIMMAIETFENNTCLRFVPRTNQPNWILYTKGQNCWSFIGRQFKREGPQEISLQFSLCHKKENIMHEMMHAIGFWHEHQRPDRDKYITIYYENFLKGLDNVLNSYGFFRKSTPSLLDSFNIMYDYNSLTQYNSKYWAKGDRFTMTAVGDPKDTKKIGKAKTLSPLDIVKINALYRCKTPGKIVLSLWSSWSLCDRVYCDKKRQRYCASNNTKIDCPTVNSFGVETQTKHCTKAECDAPIDGGWSYWSKWSSCQYCGLGTHVRVRTCINPIPFKGKNCSQTNRDIESRPCRYQFCDMGNNGCSFSKDFCSWTQNPFADVEWKQNQWNTNTNLTGPSRDHTAPDDSGTYIYMESTGQEEGARAILRSPIQPGFKYPRMRCVKFYYHMYGQDMGTLNVKLQDTTYGVYRLLLSFSGNKGDKWLEAKKTYHYSKDHMIIFEAIRGKNDTSDIAIDDIHLLWGTCGSDWPSVDPDPLSKPSKTSVEDKLDFQSGFCNWHNAISNPDNNYVPWERNYGETSTDYTGPSGGHSATGYYAYLDTSPPRTFGQRARLISKQYSWMYNCLSFWYNMNGKDVWQLNVYKNTRNNLEILLWSTNLNKGDSWKHGRVSLKGQDSFNIIIEAVTGHGERGDIGIDDVVVGRETCAPKPDIADYFQKNNLSRNGCKFDKNKQCAWTLLRGKGLWEHYQSLKPSNDTKDSYMYFYMNNTNPGLQDAYIASPFVNYEGYDEICFRFKEYIRYGRINVYMERLFSPHKQLIISRQNNKMKWVENSLTIKERGRFRIVIKAQTVGSGVNEIKIDDARFSSGKC